MDGNSNASASAQQEDILTEVANRFVMFPIRYKSIWDMYKKAESAFWTAEEIDLSKDLDDWEKLNDNERHFIKHVLAFFAGSDGIVNENLSVRFMNEVKPSEAKAFYGFQIAMENIHCVRGDTPLLTSTGYFPIESLVDTYVDVWNGDAFSRVKVLQTSELSDLQHVVLDNGMSLVCTSLHKWILPTGERIYTNALKAGMELCPVQYPVIGPSDPDEFSNPEIHGFMAFDMNNVHVLDVTNKPHLFVPVNYSISTKIEWMTGVMKQVLWNEGASTVELSSPSIAFLKQCQLLLTTFNVFSRLTTHDTAVSTLHVQLGELAKLVNYGLVLPDALSWNVSRLSSTSMTQASDNPRVRFVTHMDVSAPTYCFSEPLRQAGVFGGILTGQSETYSLLIDTYIKDTAEKQKLLGAIHTIPCIQRKAQWAMRWIEDAQATFAMRLVAFACVEGIFFSGAFCAIFWLKERGLLPGLCFSNELISRDESLHTEFAVLLYTTLHQKLDASIIHRIVGEAVEIEKQFITESIPCSLLGMNAALMSQYICYVADRLLVQLGYDKLYHVGNPFHFMDRICLDTKTNFFENREGNYAKANVGSDHAFVFTKEEDF